MNTPISFVSTTSIQGELISYTEYPFFPKHIHNYCIHHKLISHNIVDYYVPMIIYYHFYTCMYKQVFMRRYASIIELFWYINPEYILWTQLVHIYRII